MEGAVEDSFQSLLILEGEGSLRSVCGDLAVGQGDSILLPKGMGAYQLIGRLQILISEV